MKKLHISLLIIFVFILMSCDDNITNQDKNTNTKPNHPLALNSETSDLYLFSFNQRVYERNGINSTDGSRQDYYFYDSLGVYVEPNSIKINNTEIDKYKAVDLPYDGNSFSWEVVGNSDIPTFDLSVDGISMSDFYYPLPDTFKINKQTGLTLNYQPFVGASNYVLIMEENLVLTKLLLDSSINTTGQWNSEMHTIDNSGTLNISPSMLSNFKNNVILNFQLIGYNQVDTLIQNKKIKLLNGSIIDISFEVN